MASWKIDEELEEDMSGSSSEEESADEVAEAPGAAAEQESGMEVADEDEDASSDASSDSDKDEDAVDKEVAELETVLSQNAGSGFAYDKHLRLVRLLRSQGELEQLRAARQRLQRNFPLTAALWLEWVADERRLLDDETDVAARQEVARLYRLAVRDYLSGELWMDFCAFSSGTILADAAEFRAVAEDALTALGAHPTDGHLVWELYREVEGLLLTGLPAEPVEPLAAQRARVDKLFRRQLAVPHVSIEKTWRDYSHWLGRDVTPDANTQRAFQQARAAVNKLAPLEDALTRAVAGEGAAAAVAALAAYEHYLDVELKADAQPARVVCLFERALAHSKADAAFCLYPHLWLLYADYLDAKPGLGEAAAQVCARAVRNVSWSAELWLRYALLLESNGAPTEAVRQVFEDALSAGFGQTGEYLELWLAYADFVRRNPLGAPSTDFDGDEKDGDAFQRLMARAVGYMDGQFGMLGDRDGALQQYWAEMEARAGRLSRARELWAEVQRRDNGPRAVVWLQRLEWERRWAAVVAAAPTPDKSMGGTAELQRLAVQAVNWVTDEPEQLFGWVLRVFREDCSLKEFLDMRKRVAARRKQIAKQVQIAEARAESRKPASANVPQPAHEQAQEMPQRGKKRASAGAEVAGQSVERKKPPPPLPKEEEKKKVVVKAVPARVEHDPSKDHRTAFVSNLNYATEESELRELFKECGELKDLRLARDFRGRSKGFGYVEFGDAAAVTAALVLDRATLQGRPVFVSRCDAERGTSGPNFRYKMSGLEPSKLFVRNLPRGMSREALQVMFSAHGAVREVRLATLRNGKPKGHAYVEFESAADASRALVATDQLLVGENIIEVQLSNPPARGQPATSTSAPFATVLGGGGGGSGEPVGTGPRAHPSVRMMPRALSARGAAARQSSAPVPDTSEAAGSAAASAVAPKTNEQFRLLLLGKK